MLIRFNFYLELIHLHINSEAVVSGVSNLVSILIDNLTGTVHEGDRISAATLK